MVVGEPQILGQLKEAFERCRTAGLTGPSLNRAVERAFAVAKRVRTETGIGRNVVSISSIAVELARQIFGDLNNRTIALVGAGKMGELAARHLCRAGVGKLFVANRSLENANRIAQILGGHPRGLDELPGILAQADIVITSTAAREHIVNVATMKKALKVRKYRPIFIIDIAVPRNVEPALNDLDNVFLYDVDDLTAIADENMHARRKEAEAAEEMVTLQAQRFLRELEGQKATPTIVALRERAQAIRDEELERALKKMGELDPEQRKTMEMMADGIVNKLLHGLMVKLKASAAEPDAEEILRLIRDVYRLDGAEEDR
jgi:glutamyl-tRNA reductase